MTSIKKWEDGFHEKENLRSFGHALLMDDNRLTTRILTQDLVAQMETKRLKDVAEHFKLKMTQTNA